MKGRLNPLLEILHNFTKSKASLELMMHNTWLNILSKWENSLHMHTHTWCNTGDCPPPKKITTHICGLLAHITLGWCVPFSCLSFCTNLCGNHVLNTILLLVHWHLFKKFLSKTWHQIYLEKSNVHVHVSMKGENLWKVQYSFKQFDMFHLYIVWSHYMMTL